MQFKFIHLSDPYYQAELMLRWEVLGKPLGLPPGQQQEKEELESIHLVALEQKKLVGCVLFHPEGEKAGKIFQLAFSEEYRGRGFGRKMISTLEQFLAKKGISDLYVEAQEEAQGFFSSLGYHPEGLVDSTCQKMKKCI